MFVRVRNHTMYDRNELDMYKKGIGPRSLGSPLKQNTPKKDKPIYGGVLKEATVTANLPSEKHSMLDAIKYVGATGTTAKTFEPKQHPKMVRNSVKPIMGTPPMIGGGKIATKGFQLAKKVVSKLSKFGPKTASAAGEVVEAKQYYDKIKGKTK